MINLDSIRSRHLRNIGWGGAILLAAAYLAACGASPQSMAGVSPSAIGTIMAADSAGGTLSAMKDGHGNGNGNSGGNDSGKPTSPAPTAPAPTAPSTGTTPGDNGHGHDGGGDADDPGTTGGDHGNPNEPQMQFEGMATSVTGTCPALTIVIEGQTITTDLTTDFQRADCADIAAGQQLHIAATAVTTPAPPATGTTGTTVTTPAAPTTSLLASYVRLQGPKPGDGTDDGDTGDGTATPPTTTTPAK